MSEQGYSDSPPLTKAALNGMLAAIRRGHHGQRLYVVNNDPELRRMARNKRKAKMRKAKRK